MKIPIINLYNFDEFIRLEASATRKLISKIERDFGGELKLQLLLDDSVAVYHVPFEVEKRTTEILDGNREYQEVREERKKLWGLRRPLTKEEADRDNKWREAENKLFNNARKEATEKERKRCDLIYKEAKDRGYLDGAVER